MFVVDDLILAGLAGGGSLLSGLGAGKSAKKQNKMAAARQEQTNKENQWIQAEANLKNQQLQEKKNQADKELGYGLVDRGSSLQNFDLAGFAAAGDALGINRVTWLNSGALSLFDNRAERTAYVQQGTALQSPGMTLEGVTFNGTAPTVNEPNAMQAIGGAISSGASMLNSANQSTQKIAAQADQQREMINYLSSVQAARKSGNALAGLGTPSFETSSSSVSSVAAKLAAAKDDYGRPMFNSYGYKIEYPTVNSTAADQSMPNPQGGRGMGEAFFDGVQTSAADLYRRATDRNFGRDWTMLTGPGAPYANSGNTYTPMDVFRWLDREIFSTRPAY